MFRQVIEDLDEDRLSSDALRHLALAWAVADSALRQRERMLDSRGA